MTLILLSVATSCALTLPQFSSHRAANASSASPRDDTANDIFQTIDYFCGIWFTLELLARIIFCPRRRVFFRQVTNWIDILSVLPFYLRLIDPKGGALADALLMIRLLRLFRFFRLLYGLQILLHTLKASSYELGLLLLILLIPVILFSSIIYYIERTMDGVHTKFRSIPESFWWSLITMTTVGYGDIVPVTWVGKIIGGACSICGLLVVALPISIIGSNFNLYYAHAQARLKLPRKRNKVLLSSLTSDFSNRGNFTGTRRRGLRIRSPAGLEAGEDDNLAPGNGHPYRLNSFPNRNSYELKRNSRNWSIPSSKSDNAQGSDVKTSPTNCRGNRERKYSRNERVVPKLGDLPEKDETEEESSSGDLLLNSKPNSSKIDHPRHSLNVPGVTNYSPADRLPFWIAESGRSQRMRSFSVPSNTQRPLCSGPPPRKSQSQSSHICDRCSLPRETPNVAGYETSKGSSTEVCCCSENRDISHECNNSTYTIFIPGVDEGVQVSMESLPSRSRKFPLNGGSPIQLDVVPFLKRTLSGEDSDSENLQEQDEKETLISDIESEHDGYPSRDHPLLLTNRPRKHGILLDNETSI